MNYKIIDEKLGIASCCIGDLTAKQISHFLSQWEEGARIASLTLFYDSESQNVVLNRNHPNFDVYLILAEKYLAASPEKREELKEKLELEDVEEAVKVLDLAIEERDCAKTLMILGRTPVSMNGYGPDLMVFDALRKRYEPFWSMYHAYNYGIIQGKRMERARRRKAVQE